MSGKAEKKDPTDQCRIVDDRNPSPLGWVALGVDSDLFRAAVMNRLIPDLAFSRLLR
jgi:hypothetical protein